MEAKPDADLPTALVSQYRPSSVLAIDIHLQQLILLYYTSTIEWTPFHGQMK